jgi:hypothetical protein
MTDFKPHDRLMVRWAKAIVGATLFVIGLLFYDYVTAEYLPWKGQHFDAGIYVAAFMGVIFGSLHGSNGKWVPFL